MNTTAGVAAILAGLTVLFFFWGLYAPKKPLTPASNKRGGVRSVVVGQQDDTPFARYIRPLLKNLLPQLPSGLVPEGEKREKLVQLINRAGNPWGVTPEEFRGIQVLAGLTGFIAGLAFGGLGLIPVIPAPLLGVFAGVAGVAIPFSHYNSAREKRAKEVSRQLPDALDLLVVNMTSGMNFEPALASTSKRMPEGLLKDEFTKVSNEISSGRPMAEALMAFADRATSEESESFAKSVAQSQKLGSDVSEALSQQSRRARQNYEALLSKKIARLSSTMFMLLAPTIVPAFMIIFAGPTVVQLMSSI